MLIKNNRCTNSVFALSKGIDQMTLLLRMCYDNAMIAEESLGYLEASYKWTQYSIKPIIALSVICAQCYCLWWIAKFAFSWFSLDDKVPVKVAKRNLEAKIIMQPQKPLRLEQKEYALFDQLDSKEEIESHLQTITQINQLLSDDDDKKAADVKSLKSPSAIKRFTFGETLLPSKSIWSVQVPKRSPTVKADVLKLKNDKENIKPSKNLKKLKNSTQLKSAEQIKANFKKKVLSLKNQNKNI